MTVSPGSGINLSMMTATGQPTGNVQIDNAAWHSATCAPQPAFGLNTIFVGCTCGTTIGAHFGNCPFAPRVPTACAAPALNWAPFPVPMSLHVRLSDDDVERVARRVVELLREPPK